MVYETNHIPLRWHSGSSSCDPSPLSLSLCPKPPVGSSVVPLRKIADLCLRSLPFLSYLLFSLLVPFFP